MCVCVMRWRRVCAPRLVCCLCRLWVGRGENGLRSRDRQTESQRGCRDLIASMSIPLRVQGCHASKISSPITMPRRERSPAPARPVAAATARRDATPAQYFQLVLPSLADCSEASCRIKPYSLYIAVSAVIWCSEDYSERIAAAHVALGALLLAEVLWTVWHSRGESCLV